MQTSSPRRVPGCCRRAARVRFRGRLSIVASVACCAVCVCSAATTRAEPPPPSPHVADAPAVEVSAPEPLTRVDAVYPPQARAARQESSVSVLVSVDPNGGVTDVAVAESGGAEFDQAAITAARGWRFRPAQRDGQVVTGQLRISFRFALPPADAEPRCSQSLEVHVVDSLAHEPIPDVTVSVGRASVGQTGGQGRVLLTGLCPGTVALAASHPAYQPARRTVSLAQVDSVEIELDLAVSEETIVVVSKPKPAADMRSTATISGEALERRRGQPLAETLAALPGVSQLRSGSGAAKPIVRGQFGRRLPMLVDGVRHRSQDWGLDHAPEIDPFMADRLTVVRGASGVRHGSDAIGGVVLVESPEPLSNPGFAGQTHLVGFANGLGGSLASRAQWVSPATPQLSWHLDGSFQRGASPSTPDYPLDNTGTGEWSAGAGAAYRAGRHTYQLSLRHHQAQLGVCSCYHVESADDFLAQVQRGRPLGAELFRSRLEIGRPYQATTHDLALARGRWTAGSAGTVRATYAFQFDHRREFDVVRQATQGPQFAFRLLTHDLDAVFEHRPVHFSEHVHLVGSAGVVGMAQTQIYSGLPLVPSYQAGAGGSFVSERLIGDSYELEAGLRYDVLARTASIARQEFQRLVRSGQLPANACGGSDSQASHFRCGSLHQTVSASLGALRRFGTGWSAKVDLSTASRPPNPDEQYLNGTSPTFPVLGLGKPDLGAETSYSASATTSYSGARVSGEVSAHASHIDDYISFAPAIGADGRPIFDVLIRGAFPRFVTRPIDAVFYGTDGQISVSPAPWLELGGQASVVRARNAGDGSYIVFVPPDRLRGSATVTRSGLLGFEKLLASVSGTYVARQTRFDLAADLAPPPGAYLLADAELGAQMTVGGERLGLGVQMTNVFDVRYREYTSLLRYFVDQPGRQLMARLTLQYGTSRPKPN